MKGSWHINIFLLKAGICTSTVAVSSLTQKSDRPVLEVCVVACDIIMADIMTLWAVMNLLQICCASGSDEVSEIKHLYVKKTTVDTNNKYDILENLNMDNTMNAIDVARQCSLFNECDSISYDKEHSRLLQHSMSSENGVIMEGEIYERQGKKRYSYIQFSVHRI